MGAEVDQGLFDNKVQLLPALQAFPAFKSKLIFSFEIVHFDLFINSSYSLELMAESFCLFLHRNLIWNLKLPNRRGVERKGGSGGGGGGGGGELRWLPSPSPAAEPSCQTRSAETSTPGNLAFSLIQIGPHSLTSIYF